MISYQPKVRALGLGLGLGLGFAGECCLHPGIENDRLFGFSGGVLFAGVELGLETRDFVLIDLEIKNGRFIRGFGPRPGFRFMLGAGSRRPGAGLLRRLRF